MIFIKNVLNLFKNWSYYLWQFIKLGFKSKHEIKMENMALRSQLSLYIHHYEKKQLPTPRPDQAFRQLWVLISKTSSIWRSVLKVVTPKTVIGWHRSAFKIYWKRKSQKPGRPRLSNEWIYEIKKMSKDNSLYSPEKIHEQFSLKGYTDVPAPNTIAKYLPETRKNPTKKQLETWKTFMSNHMDDTWAMDFLTVPTIKFEILYVFVIIHHKTRKIIHFGVTKNPNTAWVKQHLRDATPYSKAPKYLMHDNDPVFRSKEIKDFLYFSGIQPKATSFRSPWQNPYAERVNGILRRELFDHLIPLNENHLHNKLYEYVHNYYNSHRTHQGINSNTPIPTPTHLPVNINQAKLKATPVLNGLYHTYERVA
ncbi:integrase core domain-containing protein [Barrientosiimonas marina]|uniref:Integrase core domain-containing protein n=1 Tax=Lentibacillus kimchii TaxID=1542911 RepID=A0ABW2UVR0_9BACI